MNDHFFLVSYNIGSDPLCAHGDAFRSAYPLLLLFLFPPSPSSPCIGDSGMAGRMKHFLCEAELLCQVKPDTSHPLQ